MANGRRKKRHGEEVPAPRDLNAMAMWGRCRSQTFRDRTKYTRKEKHKASARDAGKESS